MKVVPIATTQFLFDEAQKHTDYRLKPGDAATQMDLLPEFAGRMCYQSWSRPNPRTANNKGYLENILHQGHYSVLEHASVSFYVEGVSRSLLTELERHRFLSFSVISQRYVHPTEMDFVVPPALRDRYDLMIEMNEGYTHALWLYDELVNELKRQGFSKKQAQEAARAVLPNGTEVKMVVTGNIRAWRDVLGKRYHQAADAEIREFAAEVLRHLRTLVPHSVQDIPEQPFGT